MLHVPSRGRDVQTDAGQPGVPSRSDVLLRYHAVMTHFLETQRAVMLGYLDAVRPASTSAAVPAPVSGPTVAAPIPSSPGMTTQSGFTRDPIGLSPTGATSARVPAPPLTDMLELDADAGGADDADDADELSDGSRHGLHRWDPHSLAVLRGCRIHNVGAEIVVERALSVAHDRYLDHHRIDRKAVFPFAGAMELMAATASLAMPDRVLTGLDDIRVLKGIMIPDGEGLRVTVTTQTSTEGLKLTITSTCPHYRSIARFDPVAEIELPAALGELARFPVEISDVYRKQLFHGPLLHGIAAVSGLDARGASATLTPSRPGDWITGGDGARWLLDPGLIDSAFQLQVIWGQLYWDVFLLPAELATCRIFDVPHPGELIRHELRIRPESKNPASHANHWLFGTDHRLLATLIDVVGVGSKALNRLAERPTATREV